MQAFAKEETKRTQPAADEVKPNIVTVNVHPPDLAAVNGRAAESKPPKPPASVAGAAYRGFWSVRWTSLVVAVIWDGIGLVVVTTIFLHVTALGLGHSVPSVFGQRMSKSIGFGWMASLQNFYRTTLGHMAALGLMSAVVLSWHFVIREFLLVRGNDFDESVWKGRNTRLFWRVAGSALLLTDAILFFRGISELNSWSGSSDRGSALLITVVYVFGLAVFSAASLKFWSHVQRGEK